VLSVATIASRADEPIDRQRPTELESALPATSYGLDLDLVS